MPKIGLRFKLLAFAFIMTNLLLVTINLVMSSQMGFSNPGNRLTVFIWEIAAWIILLLLTSIFSGWLLRPLRQIRESSQRIGQGDFNYRLGEDDLEGIGSSFNQMSSKLQKLYRGMQEDQARLEASLNSINVGFIMTDATLNIITINRTAMDLLGKLPLKDSAHANWGIDLIARQISSEVDIAKSLRDCMKQRQPIELNDIAAGDLTLNLFIAPILAGPNDFGTVMIIDDITETKIAERGKNEFFSIASHELRTPLTVIRGNISIMQNYYAKKLNDPDLKGMVEDMYESSGRLIQIVNDFLDTSRIEQNRIQYILEDLSLPPLVTEVIHELKPLADRKKLKLKQSIGTNIKLVKADRNRIKQVLYNLIDNAIKFTRSGTIKVTVVSEDGFIKVAVKDSGSGVAAANSKLLFRKFQQAGTDPLTRDASNGTGLGLFISKALIDDMGGQIYLAKSSPKGSEFVFTLPEAKRITPVQKTRDIIKSA